MGQTQSKNSKLKNAGAESCFASLHKSELLIGLGMIVSRLLKPAIVGIVVFSLAIAPLGLASAFPCTVILAIAAVMMNHRTVEPDNHSA